MPKKITCYECPFCNEVYESEYARADCARDCLNTEGFEIEAWKCLRCGIVFSHKVLALKHEAECYEDVKLEPKGQETCFTCKHSDKEGHKWSPCPNYHFAPAQSACEHYAYADR